MALFNSGGGFNPGGFARPMGMAPGQSSARSPWGGGMPSMAQMLRGGYGMAGGGMGQMKPPGMVGGGMGGGAPIRMDAQPMMRPQGAAAGPPVGMGAPPVGMDAPPMMGGVMGYEVPAQGMPGMGGPPAVNPGAAPGGVPPIGMGPPAIGAQPGAPETGGPAPNPAAPVSSAVASTSNSMVAPGGTPWQKPGRRPPGGMAGMLQRGNWGA